jgi:hypothetical protein
MSHVVILVRFLPFSCSRKLLLQRVTIFRRPERPEERSPACGALALSCVSACNNLKFRQLRHPDTSSSIRYCKYQTVSCRDESSTTSANIQWASACAMKVLYGKSVASRFLARRGNALRPKWPLQQTIPDQRSTPLTLYKQRPIDASIIHPEPEVTVSS